MYSEMQTRIITLTILFLIIPCSYAVEKIVVNGLFKNKAVVTIDGKQRILKVGEASPEGVRLISSNSREAVIEVDGEQNTYQLGTHIGSNYKEPPASTTVTVIPDQTGSYFVNGSINDFQVRFLVDTGATLIFMNAPTAKRIGLNYKLEGVEGLAETASGTTSIYSLTLKKVKVGNIELRDVAAAVSDDEYPLNILLGASFLNRINSSRDGRIMVLEQK